MYQDRAGSAARAVISYLRENRCIGQNALIPTYCVNGEASSSKTRLRALYVDATAARPLPTLGWAGFYVSNVADCCQSRHRAAECQLPASANSQSRPFATFDEAPFERRQYGGLPTWWRRAARDHRIECDWERRGRYHAAVTSEVASKVLDTYAPESARVGRHVRTAQPIEQQRYVEVLPAPTAPAWTALSSWPSTLQSPPQKTLCKSLPPALSQTTSAPVTHHPLRA